MQRMSIIQNHALIRIKKGGSVKKDAPKKFAMGGVAKIRHDEATAQGMPRSFKKQSLKDIL
jgi:hypothetical protein